MKKTDLAYVAGIVDGEGCITFSKVRQYYKPQVLVANTNEWLIKQLYFWFGGCVSQFNPKSKKDNWKDLWHWRLNCKKAADFCTLILPYLRIKKPQAELLIQFQNRRMHKPYPRRRTPGQHVLDDANALLMRQYNKRGREVNNNA